MKKTIVVNLFGGPGTGKSTGACYIFAKLKMARPKLNFERADEYAKDKAWEGTIEQYNQFYLSGKQSWKIKRLYGKVDVLITDSPIILGAMYCEDNPLLVPALIYESNKYNNVNIFLKRVKEYNPDGRTQSFEEAEAIDAEIKGFLEKNNIPFIEEEASEQGYDKIVKWLLSELDNKA